MSSKPKGIGINLEAALTGAVLIFAAVQLLTLVRTGAYLNYVTPRMKPYLYGLSVLMLLWAALAGRQLFSPRYQVRLSKPLFLLLPMLLMTVMPGDVQGSSLMKNADADSFRMQALEQKGRFSPEARRAADSVAGEELTGDWLSEMGAAGFLTETNTEGLSAGEADALQAETDRAAVLAEETGGLPLDEETEAASQASTGTDTDLDAVPASEAAEALPGLDEAGKRITIADGTYYEWVMELSMNYQKYIGYTVQMKGFVYRGEDILSQADFALARLSMWCCAADLTPLGFLIQSEQAAAFPDDAWVTVTGTFSVNADETAIILHAKDIQPAQEPEEPFVYPSYF